MGIGIGTRMWTWGCQRKEAAASASHDHARSPTVLGALLVMIQLVIAAIEVLDELWSARIVHRDISGANLMVDGGKAGGSEAGGGVRGVGGPRSHAKAASPVVALVDFDGAISADTCDESLTIADGDGTIKPSQVKSVGRCTGHEIGAALSTCCRSHRGIPPPPSRPASTCRLSCGQQHPTAAPPMARG